MADIVDAPTRSRMMAAVRGKDTKPELVIRRALHARGLRYRLHARDLQGRPDLVLPRHRAAIFVHGCFWHGHQCHLFRWPATRPEFWRAKIGSNMQRDHAALAALNEAGWRVGTVYECALRGRARPPLETVMDCLEAFVLSREAYCEISGAA